MVIYFESRTVNPPAKLYMGADKFENEDLIKWGWPEDVWFHVDNLSSAHVYLRLRKTQSLDDVPEELLEECAQLVKANSIQGSKQNNVDVVYTMWNNLKKTPDMIAGQIGYHNEKEVRKINVPRKKNEIINRLNKTKVTKDPNLREEREERDRKEREILKAMARAEKEREKKEAKLNEEREELKSFSSLMKTENMKSNAENDEDSDDFM